MLTLSVPDTELFGIKSKWEFYDVIITVYPPNFEDLKVVKSGFSIVHKTSLIDQMTNPLDTNKISVRQIF